MKKAADYLQKFVALRLPDEAVRKATQEIVMKEVGIAVELNDIRVRCGVISISHLSPAARSEVYMRKRDILHGISEKIPKGAPRDVRLS